MIKPWWEWAFWVSPLTYGQRAISVNEFTATRWMEVGSLYRWMLDVLVIDKNEQ